MTISDSFSTFLDNIKVGNYEIIAQRYKEITKKLNKTFRDTDSETANSLQVGSYGRYTGIKGISDLDMLYIMPQNKWDDYKDSPSQLLRDVRDAIQERYPTTDVSYDRLVVDIKFTNFVFEVQPVFETADDDGTHTNYRYPDTKTSNYKITKPKQEQEAMTEFRQNHGRHHRLLCKMARSWKNNVGVSMGGLLLDTLAYNFLKGRSDLDFSSYTTFDTLSRDFLEYLKDQPKQDHYQALGSNQDVKVKHSFRSKAAKSFQKAKDACEATDEATRNDIWREVYGKDFPKVNISVQEYVTYTDNEEFIEDKYPINIRYNLQLDCEIARNGFRENLLSKILASGQKICRVRSLDFMLKTDAPEPYTVKWKARNIGPEAKRRNCLRGEVIDSNRKNFVRHESADFCGPHYMECYIIKDGIVVARDRIDVLLNSCIMNRKDLLKIIAQKGYTIGYAANLNFATYDIVNKVPKWIAFLSIVVGIIGLACPAFTAKAVSIIILILSIASIYIEGFTSNISSYEEQGKKNTDQQNRLKNLYYQVKGLEDTAIFNDQEAEYADIEKEFNNGSQSKQIVFANWFAHYKLFCEKDISWMDEQLHFGWWKDKIPQSAKACSLILLLVIVSYYCYAIPTVNNFFIMVLFIK